MTVNKKKEPILKELRKYCFCIFYVELHVTK